MLLFYTLYALSVCALFTQGKKKNQIFFYFFYISCILMVLLFVVTLLACEIKVI